MKKAIVLLAEGPEITSFLGLVRKACPDLENLVDQLAPIGQ